MNDTNTLPSPENLPTSYKVRDVIISPNVVLAPMEGVTDLVFRRVIRSIGGPGLTYTEFIASKGIKEGHSKMRRTATFDPEENPIALQIYGRDPQIMADAARKLQDLGATIVDINMGCPSKRVCKRSGGSALMREPDHAVEIVRAVRKAIDIPLTVKMRSGFDASCRNAPELAWRCQEEGAEAITIHWRTREDRYSGVRAVDKIAETVDRVSVPVIGNGDIVDIPSAHAMLTETGCAGVMIGRGAIQNPWVLLQVGQWLRGEPILKIDATERERVLLDYFDKIYEAFDSEKGALGRMKMVIKLFAEEVPFGEGLRAEIFHAQTRNEAVSRARNYFDLLRLYEEGHQAPLLESSYADAARARQLRKEARKKKKEKVQRVAS